ncbi:phage portal protein [Tsukamurella sputi]|uniref:Phage portal protein n=1 Tax=Tsukamurella sputi TaxID=2591848 RepID=A0A5C5RRX1_9ACTN|nr:phage portal protein [Tsukamurella sputi]TWS25360.1 phage portal protein [Tsukamurella sputi]
MRPNDAVAAALNIMNGARAWESVRLERIFRAMQPARDLEPPKDGQGRYETDLWLNTWSNQLGPNPLDVQVPRDAPAAMHRLAGKSRTNFLPLVVDTFSQVMKVDNYLASDGLTTPSAWNDWQRNRFDARQTGVHRAALQYGVSYVTVLPGDSGIPDDSGPVWRGVSPRNMTAVYDDPTADEWPMMALEIDRQLVKLYDETNVYFLGAENVPTDSWGYPNWNTLAHGLTYIEAREHGVGRCPVVRFQDKMLLEGEEQFGIVEPLMTIQQRINETNFGLLVTQYFSAFRQRYVMGWYPDSEADEARAFAGDTWLFKDAGVKVGQFEESSPEYYIKSKAAAIQDLSAISQQPLQNFGSDGISNISAETLSALETGMARKSDEITTSLGESWEQAFRLSAYINGDSDGARDFGSEVKWRDVTSRSFAQTVDGLGKLGQMLGVPDEILWEDIPNWTREKVERAKAMRQNADPLSALYLDAAQAAPAVSRGIETEATVAADDRTGTAGS